MCCCQSCSSLFPSRPGEETSLSSSQPTRSKWTKGASLSPNGVCKGAGVFAQVSSNCSGPALVDRAGEGRHSTLWQVNWSRSDFIDALRGARFERKYKGSKCHRIDTTAILSVRAGVRPPSPIFSRSQRRPFFHKTRHPRELRRSASTSGPFCVAVVLFCPPFACSAHQKAPLLMCPPLSPLLRLIHQYALQREHVRLPLRESAPPMQRKAAVLHVNSHNMVALAHHL